MSEDSEEESEEIEATEEEPMEEMVDKNSKRHRWLMKKENSFWKKGRKWTKAKKI